MWRGEKERGRKKGKSVVMPYNRNEIVAVPLGVTYCHNVENYTVQ